MITERLRSSHGQRGLIAEAAIGSEGEGGGGDRDGDGDEGLDGGEREGKLGWGHTLGWGVWSVCERQSPAQRAANTAAEIATESASEIKIALEIAEESPHAV